VLDETLWFLPSIEAIELVESALNSEVLNENILKDEAVPRHVHARQPDLRVSIRLNEVLPHECGQQLQVVPFAKLLSHGLSLAQVAVRFSHRFRVARPSFSLVDTSRSHKGVPHLGRLLVGVKLSWGVEM